jgi:hypothetical protein
VPEQDVSPIIKNLIDRGLFDRLPATFTAFFFDQFQRWRLLFPAEQNYQERLFTLLDSSPTEEVNALFEPLRQVERRMGVNDKTWPRRHFNTEQVMLLNKSAYSNEWRQAIAHIFGRIDPLLDAERSRKGKPALVIITSPPEVPASPDRMWLRLTPHGKRIAIESSLESGYLGALTKGHSTESIFETYPKNLYDSWAISAGKPAASGRNAVVLSYEALSTYRSRLMGEIQKMLESGAARTPSELNERLQHLNIHSKEGGFDTLVSEFIRTILLSGNGTLLINNTFVEWATVQAIRRARPALMSISFGVRNKLKPFSNLLMYSDQDIVNAIPSQMDTLGTYIDLELFYLYIWQEFEKYVEYRNNTAYLFVADGSDQLFCIAPADFPLLSERQPIGFEQVHSCIKEWLNI